MELGITGHLTRNDEVVKILEMLGGKNQYKIVGGLENHFYYIGDKDKYINNSYIGSDEIKGYEIFSLEGFLEKFPYKVGDKVEFWSEVDYYGRTELETSEIISMRWNSARCEIAYRLKGECKEFYKSDIKGKVKENLFHTTNEYEEIIEKSFQGGYEKCKLDIQLNGYKLPDGYHFTDENGNVIDAKKILLVKNAPFYPKTYEECCNVLSMERAIHYNLRYFTYERGFYEYATTDKLCSLQDKLNILGKLIICRNAYWKIAGEYLELDKPWEPKNELSTRNKIYDIRTYCNKIEKGSTEYPTNKLLSFPTKEMRDVFYDNFKYLIETCKELL